MRLTLNRTTQTPESTIGELLVDGAFECYTLELPVKDGLPGSAIPEGTYPVVLAPSPKFERSSDPWVQNYAAQIPHIIQIADRTDILIHWGNDPADTNGCVLVGERAGLNMIFNSRLAFSALFLKIQAGVKTDGCSITVTHQVADLRDVTAD